MSEPDSSRANNDDRALRIHDAAARLISHYGYDKTTVSDIAREAGVSKGAIYLHWKSKEELFEALLWREIRRYTEELWQRIEADPEGATFSGMMKNSMLALNDSPLLKSLYRRDKRVLGSFARRQENAAYQMRFTMGTEFLQMMQDAGVIRADLDPEVVAYILSMIRYGFLSIDDVIPPEIAPPVEVVFETLGVMIDRALAPDGGGDIEAGKRILGQMFDIMRQQLEQPMASGD